MKNHKIDVIFFDKIKTDKKLLVQVMKRLIEEQNIKEQVSISIVLVGNKTIKELNKNFRKKNKVTSVLSFPLLGKRKFVTGGKRLSLCDIIINIEKLKKAKDLKNTLKENLTHSFLHLLNFSHKDMEKEEKKLMEALSDI